MTTPSNEQSLEGLVERVKAATGPDMLLSNDIWRAVRGQEPGSILYHETPDVTDSIDAALALMERVLPGWKRSLFEKRGGGWIARVSSPRWETYTSGEDDPMPTAPLALTLATVIALQSSETRK